TYFCFAFSDSGGEAKVNATPLPLVGGGGMATVVIRVDRGRTTSQAGYDALVAHEIGHAIGIGAHSNTNTDLMFALPAVVAPSARDIATLRFILGRAPDITL